MSFFVCQKVKKIKNLANFVQKQYFCHDHQFSSVQQFSAKKRNPSELNSNTLQYMSLTVKLHVKLHTIKLESVTYDIPHTACQVG